VLTGVDTRESILAARSQERPSYLIPDLTALYEPYPAISEDGGRFRCGNSTAYVQDSTVTVEGLADELDSWRAACAAWWAATPDAAEATAPRVEWIEN